MLPGVVGEGGAHTLSLSLPGDSSLSLQDCEMSSIA